MGTSPVTASDKGELRARCQEMGGIDRNMTLCSTEESGEQDDISSDVWVSPEAGQTVSSSHSRLC